MAMFYFDDRIKEFEHKHNFNMILDYLENLFYNHKTVNYLSTIIAYSWYFLTSNEFDNEPTYDWKNYLEKWIYYLEIGKKEFFDNPIYNFIAGYTLGLHHDYIDSSMHNYEKEYQIFMKKAATQNTMPSVKLLAENYLVNKHNHLPLKNNSIDLDLFPSNSYLDRYFREIYN